MSRNLTKQEIKEEQFKWKERYPAYGMAPVLDLLSCYLNKSPYELDPTYVDRANTITLNIDGSQYILWLEVTSENPEYPINVDVDDGDVDDEEEEILFNIPDDITENNENIKKSMSILYDAVMDSFNNVVKKRNDGLLENTILSFDNIKKRFFIIKFNPDCVKFNMCLSQLMNIQANVKNILEEKKKVEIEYDDEPELKNEIKDKEIEMSNKIMALEKAEREMETKKREIINEMNKIDKSKMDLENEKYEKINKMLSKGPFIQICGMNDVFCDDDVYSKLPVFGLNDYNPNEEGNSIEELLEGKL